LEKSEPAKAALPDILLLGGDGGYSGVPTFLGQLCAALKDHATFTIISDRNEGGYDFAKGGITLREVDGMKTGLSLRRFWRALQVLDTQISSGGYELVWAHARMSLIQLRALMILRRLRGQPMPRCAVTYHGLPFGPGHRRSFSVVSLFLERMFLALAPPHQLHFLSAADMDHFTARLGARALARHTSTVLPNCSRLGPLPPRTQNSSPTLLMTGRAGHQKNHPAAAQLFAALPDNFQLILCGAGTEAQKMAPVFEAAQTGLSKRVQFLGPISDVRALLAQADVLLMPSRYEGMPIAALEAFEAGLPMVLSDTPSMAGILALHPMAVALDITAPQAVAAEVVTLIDQFRRAPNTTKQTQKIFALHFSYDRWQEKVQDLTAGMLR
jgi:glycosyltransferase involved in cell wall biosynthesis